MSYNLLARYHQHLRYSPTMKNRRCIVIHEFPAALALLAAAALPGVCPAPGTVQLDLLRNANLTSLNPVTPPLPAIFWSSPADPVLDPVTDREAVGFVSGGAFPNQATDLGNTAQPLVFYQLNSPTYIIKLQKSAGNLVITYSPSAQRAITLPRPGGGAMIGGARAGVILMADGTVWNWGGDFSFRLGQGNAVATDLYLPAQVHGPGNVGFLNSITAIAAGEPFSMALKSDGTVWTWGSNMNGLLGIGNTVPASSNVPVQVVDTTGPGSCLSGVSAIGTRGYHALALKSDGTVYGWGWCGMGECGNNSTVTPQPSPVQVQGLSGSPVIAVEGGYQYSVALKADKTVWGWGRNALGELGDGTVTSPRLVPQRVGLAMGLGNITQISSGWGHVLARRSDGTVWAWGQNDYGQIGDGNRPTNQTTPFQVKGPGGVGVLSNIIMVSGGDCSSAALRADGTVWTWGCNHHNGYNPPPVGTDPVGQLGNNDPTYTDQPYPVQVVGGAQGGPFLQSIVMIAARDYHNYALASDGTLYSWGSNLNGQIGYGSCCLPGLAPKKVIFP